jgi:hypothetical protein
MIIDMYTPFAESIVVVKGGVPQGLVQRVDTDAKRYMKIISLTEFKEEAYDRIVMCPEMSDAPKSHVERFREAGVETLTIEEMEEVLACRLPKGAEEGQRSLPSRFQ